MKYFKIYFFSIVAVFLFGVLTVAHADTVPTIGIVTATLGYTSGCTGFGNFAYTSGGVSDPAGNGGTEPHCAAIALSSQGPFTEDFRIGFRMGDGYADWGPWTYTPWASENPSASSFSPWTSELNHQDPRYYQLTLETRALAPNTFITNVSFGLSLAEDDNSASHAFGSYVYPTGWNPNGTPNSGIVPPPLGVFDQGIPGPDGAADAGRVSLGATLRTLPSAICTVNGSASPITVNYGDTVTFSAQSSGFFAMAPGTYPLASVFNIFNSWKDKFLDLFYKKAAANVCGDPSCNNQVTCNVSGGGNSATVEVNQTVSFSAGAGVHPYTWTADGGSPSSGTNTSFSTSYAQSGSYTVNVDDSAGNSDVCTVTVTSPPTYAWVYPPNTAPCPTTGDANAQNCTTAPLSQSLNDGNSGGFSVTVHQNNTSVTGACPAVTVNPPPASSVPVLSTSWTTTSKQQNTLVSGGLNQQIPVPFYVRNVGPTNSFLKYSCTPSATYLAAHTGISIPSISACASILPGGSNF